MRKIIFIVVAAIIICSCGKKKEPTLIMTTVDTTQVNKTDTISMEPKVMRQQVKLDGKTYTLDIERHPDKSLPTVTDQQERYYYDNRITVMLDGPEGQVLNRTFRKSDFLNYINTQYVKPHHSVLSTIAFKKTDDDEVELVASVGSPDQLDDNYMLVQMTIDKHGNISMERIDQNED